MGCPFCAAPLSAEDARGIIGASPAKLLMRFFCDACGNLSFVELPPGSDLLPPLADDDEEVVEGEEWVDDWFAASEDAQVAALLSELDRLGGTAMDLIGFWQWQNETQPWTVFRESVGGWQGG